MPDTAVARLLPAMKGHVVVVGAGPVGLTTALALARSSLHVSVLEKRTGPNLASRASTFHPPTLDILSRLGVADDLLNHGTRASRIGFRDLVSGAACELDMSLLRDRCRFAFRVHYEQANLVRVLLQALSDLPTASVRFQAEVVDVEYEPRVIVHFRNVFGRVERMAADAVVAADGMGSRVRTALGIAFAGKDYDSRVLRVMTKSTLDAADAELAPVSYLYLQDDSMSMLRMPDCWRLIMRLDAAEKEEQFDDPVLIRKRLAKFLPRQAEVLTIDAHDSYSASLRQASTWQCGRVALAGDAAHVTNTRGGMNMNCGIHDAWCLSRHLVHGFRTDSIESELMHYAASRREIVRTMLVPRTDSNVVSGRERVARMVDICGDEDATLDWLRRAAMLDMVEIEFGGDERDDRGRDR